MQQATSDIIRKLMRLVVTDGYGKSAEVPGYFVGGKTGTAEKISGHGHNKKANVSAFISVFPMNAPRYAVYMMLDEPHADASTHGYATAGWVSAPAAGRVIARIGPMLGLLPETDNAAAIQASLAIPMEPARPPGAVATPPPAPGMEQHGAPSHGAPVAQAKSQAKSVLAPVTTPMARDLRHNVLARMPANVGQ
jgi:cell division protein FtsI (penicillin-binding protein 3)